MASLGLLGLRLTNSNPVKREVLCLVVAYVLLAIVLVAHLMAILWDQQRTLLQIHYDFIMYLTMTLVAGIVVCFVLLLWFQTTIRDDYDAVKSVRNVVDNQDLYIESAEADASVSTSSSNPGGIINN